MIRLATIRNYKGETNMAIAVAGREVILPALAPELAARIDAINLRILRSEKGARAAAKALILELGAPA